MKSLRYPLLNVVFFVLAIYVNYLSVVTNLGGRTIRELSDKYDNLFTPSNQTFAIWSLIYTLVTGFLILQFFKKYKTSINQNPLFILSCIFNLSWIVFWQFEYIFISLLVMLALLTTLALINLELKKNGNLFYRITFGVYLGWICIATIANVTTFLVSKAIRFDVSTEEIITIGILAVGSAIVVWIMRTVRNASLAIAVCWAFYGIYVKRNADHPVIANTALFALALVIVAAIWVAVNKKTVQQG